MVKRAISIVLGAAAGVALWFAFNAVLNARSQEDSSAAGCLREAFVECVGFKASQQAAPVGRNTRVQYIIPRRSQEYFQTR